MRNLTILGSGGMGTAMAILAGGNQAFERVRLWSRDPALASILHRSRENVRHLSGVALPPRVEVTCQAAEALDGSDLILAAIPTAHLRATLRRLAHSVPAAAAVLSVIKGVELETFCRPSQIIAQELKARPIAILSGPCHAEECARGQPTSLALAGDDPEVCRLIRDRFMNDAFRIYLNNDPLGVELAGALKNILGLAAGICDGLGFGDNAKAALLTRGLVEMARFAAAQGAVPATFWGLAGVGDVLTTCYSPYGRNRSVGLAIGRGQALSQILAGMADVAEGVTTTQSVHDMAQAQGIDMPITREVQAILFQSKAPRDAVQNLMLRDPKCE